MIVHLSWGTGILVLFLALGGWVTAFVALKQAQDAMKLNDGMLADVRKGILQAKRLEKICRKYEKHASWFEGFIHGALTGAPAPVPENQGEEE